MTESFLPNFLIVGAVRSGTTSPYNYLIKHPQVFMSKVKEPCFFAFANKSIRQMYKQPLFEYYTEFDKYKNCLLIVKIIEP